jgi:hypothetical protein
MADKEFNVNKGLAVKGITVIDETRNVSAVALTVTNTNVVTNLNADKVDGYDAVDLAARTENETITGNWEFSGRPIFSIGSGSPFSVTSTGAVANLNADMIDGAHASDFLRLNATGTAIETITFQKAPTITVADPATLPPLVVNSSVKVAGLNADLLDGFSSSAATAVSTIALRDSSGDLSARNFISENLSTSQTLVSRTTDSVFYSSDGNMVYKNNGVGLKTSLGLNSVENTALSTWAGSSNITTLGAASSSGALTASTFISSVATGTAPLTVSSQTMVTNLNAQFLNGIASSGILSSSSTFYLGTTQISLSRTSGSPHTLDGVNVTYATTAGTCPSAGYLTASALNGYVTTSQLSSASVNYASSAGTASSAGSATTAAVATTATTATKVANKLTFADTTTYDGSAAKTLTAATLGCLSTSGGTLSGNVTSSAIITAGVLISNQYIDAATGVNITGAGGVWLTNGAFYTPTGTAFGLRARTGGGFIAFNPGGPLVLNANTTVDLRTNNDTWWARCNAGDYWSNGYLVASGSSDIKLKENIIPITYGLKAIEAINPVNFDWKDIEKHSGRKGFGFIAQEMQEIIPEIVYKYTSIDDGETLAIEYQNIIPILVRAIQEQQVQIKELKETIGVV